MKRKLLALLLCSALFICSAAALCACDFGASPNDGANSGTEQPAPDPAPDGATNNETTPPEEEDLGTTGTEGLSYTLSKDGTYYMCSGKGTAKGADIKIASTYKGKPVKEVRGSAFYISLSLNSVVIPDSVTTIAYRAFMCAYYLKSVTLGNGVVTIGEQAFKDTALENIIIPKSVKTIGECAFDGYAFTDVYYRGSEEEWNNIDGHDNLSSNVTIHYNYTGE